MGGNPIEFRLDKHYVVHNPNHDPDGTKYEEYYKSGKVKLKGVMADPGNGWNASLTGKYVSYYETGGVKKKGEYFKK